MNTRNRTAIILPVVLLMIGLLALMAAGFVFFIRAEASGTQALADGHQARLAAESGLEAGIATIRVNRHDASAFFDVPQKFRHGLVHSPGYRREDDPVRAMGSRTELLEATPIVPAWRYAIVGANTDGPPDTMRYGLTPESGKLNINAATDEQIEGLLGPLLAGLEVENSQELINAVMDWLDPDSTPREGGAESDYYGTLEPPYQAKNGPLNTVEELLLVKGFNAIYLYGEDVNRNGVLDANEDDGAESYPFYDNADGLLNPGIVPYITVWSREPDTALDNKPRINLNADANVIQAQIATYIKAGELSDATIQYIVGLKQQGFNFSQWPSAANLYGAGTELDEQERAESAGTEAEEGGATPGAEEGGGAPSGGVGVNPRRGGSRGENDEAEEEQGGESGDSPGVVPNPRGGRGGSRTGGGTRGGTEKSSTSQVREDERTGGAQSGQPSEEELMNRLQEMAAQAGDQASDRGGGGTGRGTPRGRSGRRGGGGGGGEVRPSPSPVTLEEMNVIMDRFSTRGAEQAQGLMGGLININTAPARVLALIPGMTPEAAAAIAESRNQLAPDAKRMAGWPLVSGAVEPLTFRKIAPHITTKSYQYHVEVLGYADHVKIARRYEWIIEMIGPLAQVKYHRDLTSLGRAWPIDDDNYLISGAK